MPEGLTLNLACQRTFALLCVRTVDTWWNNRFGLKKILTARRAVHGTVAQRGTCQSWGVPWMTKVFWIEFAALGPWPKRKEPRRSRKRAKPYSVTNPQIEAANKFVEDKLAPFPVQILRTFSLTLRHLHQTHKSSTVDNYVPIIPELGSNAHLSHWHCDN